MASTTIHTVMPPPRSCEAPYFSGQDHDLEDFLQEYELITDSCGLTNEQKVDRIVLYIHRSERNLWRTLEGYNSRDWAKFRHSVEDIYVGGASRRRSKQQLYDFVKFSMKLYMEGDDDVFRYYQHFQILSHQLLDGRRLSEEERDMMFWLGFHPEDRVTLSHCLLYRHPDQSAGVPFNYTEVFELARSVFSGPRSPSFLLEDQLDDLPGTGSNTTEYRTRQARSWQETEVFPIPMQASNPEAVRRKELTREEEDREIDDLVRRLRGLSVQDNAYKTLYARCAHRFPDFAKTLPKPDFFSK